MLLRTFTLASAGIVVFGLTLVARQGTPPAIVDQLQREVVNGLARPQIRAHLVNTGVEPVGSTPAEFSAFTLAERARWAAVIRSAKIDIAP